jgi:hypothetical protein
LWPRAQKPRHRPENRCCAPGRILSFVFPKRQQDERKKNRKLRKSLVRAMSNSRFRLPRSCKKEKKLRTEHKKIVAARQVKVSLSSSQQQPERKRKDVKSRI